MNLLREKRSRIACCALALAAFGLASCGGDDPEEPRGGPQAIAERTATATPSATMSPTPTPTPTREPNPLAGLRPCALLSAGQQRTLGLSGARNDRVGDARVCRLRYEGATLRDSYTVGIELFERHGVDDAVSEREHRIPPIGTHRAVKFVNFAGGCGVAIATGPSSRVDATAVGGGHAHACRLALQVARAVEPRLP